MFSTDGSRCTSRLLQSELVKDGVIEPDIMEELCKVFEGGELYKCRGDDSAHIYQHTRKPRRP
jgi:hypothetical protein